MQNLKASIINLGSFEDLVYFMHTRITTVNPHTSILCTDQTCFTIISGGENYLFVVTAPAPHDKCRFAYIDEGGKVRCTNTPIPGKPFIVLVSVRSTQSLEDISQFLSSLK